MYVVTFNMQIPCFPCDERGQLWPSCPEASLSSQSMKDLGLTISDRLWEHLLCLCCCTVGSFTVRTACDPLSLCYREFCRLTQSVNFVSVCWIMAQTGKPSACFRPGLPHGVTLGGTGIICAMIPPLPVHLGLLLEKATYSTKYASAL